MIEVYFYQITLALGVKPDDFEKFVTDEIFPTIRRTPDRRGGVDELHLFRDTQADGSYLWTINWNGLTGALDVDIPEQITKLETFGAHTSFLGTLNVDPSSPNNDVLGS